MTPELAIIIVNWNGGSFLRGCLDSVVRFPPPVPFEVIVVDNASTDNSREIACSYENVRLLPNKENVGFGRANNQAFAVSEAPLLFVLNNDAEIHAGAFDRLLTTINEDERIGVVGPRLLNTDGTLQPSVWRNPLTSFEMIMTTLHLHKLLPKRFRGDLLLGFHWDHMQRRSVRMLSGAALLVRRSVIDDVGGFDERFHMYGEDTEWALRIVRGGWSLIFESAATVTHHGGRSAAQRWLDLDKREKEYEGFFRFQRLQLSRRQAITNLMTGYTLSLIRNAWKALLRQPRGESRLVCRLYRDELKRSLFPEKPLADVPGQIAKRPL